MVYTQVRAFLHYYGGGGVMLLLVFCLGILGAHIIFILFPYLTLVPSGGASSPSSSVASS